MRRGTVWLIAGLAATLLGSGASAAGTFSWSQLGSYGYAVFDSGGQHGVIYGFGIGEARTRLRIDLAATSGDSEKRFLQATIEGCARPAAHQVFRARFPVNAGRAFVDAVVAVRHVVRALRLYDGPDASGPLLACARLVPGRIPPHGLAGDPDWSDAGFDGGPTGDVILRDNDTGSLVAAALSVGSPGSTWRVIGSSKRCAFQHNQTDLEFLVEQHASTAGTLFVRTQDPLPSLSTVRSIRLFHVGVPSERYCTEPTNIQFPN